ncbi:MAG: DUF167 family protein [Ferroplasma sp.]
MRINVHVFHGKQSIIDVDGILNVYTKEPFENNRANIDIIRQVAKYYSVGSMDVSIVSGFSSRKKILEVKK